MHAEAVTFAFAMFFAFTAYFQFWKYKVRQPVPLMARSGLLGAITLFVFLLAGIAGKLIPGQAAFMSPTDKFLKSMVTLFALAFLFASSVALTELRWDARWMLKYARKPVTVTDFSSFWPDRTVFRFWEAYIAILCPALAVLDYLCNGSIVRVVVWICLVLNFSLQWQIRSVKRQLKSRLVVRRLL